MTTYNVKAVAGTTDTAEEKLGASLGSVPVLSLVSRMFPIL